MIGNAVKIMHIATGEDEYTVINDGKDLAAKVLGAKGGKKRAENMTAAAGQRLRIRQQKSAVNHRTRINIFPFGKFLCKYLLDLSGDTYADSI